MEHSKLPMYSWFYTMHLMASIKQVLSAKEVQYQLHMPEYPPVWLMMMKMNCRALGSYHHTEYYY